VPFYRVKILITRNFVSTSFRQVLFINPFSVHGNECSNMFVIIIYWFGVQLKIDPYFYYQLVLIAQCKISVLATPVTSSNLRNQAPLFTELRL